MDASFVSTAPALVATVLVCLAPGIALTVAMGLRGYPIVGYAPPLALLAVVASGSLARLVGMDQRSTGAPLSLLAVTAIGVGICILVRGRQSYGRPTIDGGPAAVIAASLVTGAGAFAFAIGAAIRTPSGWPQMPDAIYHVGAVTWMVRNGSAWIGDVPMYASPHGGSTAYPGVWHSTVATVAAWTDASPLVASHALVVVVGGLIWPLSLLTLTRQIASASRLAAPLTVAASLIMFSMPFQPVAWGVLWPYLLGVALVPTLLAAAHRVAAAEHPRLGPRRWVSWLLLGTSAAAASLSHPSVIFGSLLLAVPLVAGVLHRQGRHRAARAAALVGVLLGAALWSIRPDAMVNKGLERRAATPLEAAAHLLSGFSPVPTFALILAVIVVAVAVILAGRAETRWVTWGIVATMTLSTVNLMSPDGLGAALAWPWWGDSARIRTLMAVPVAAGLVLLVRSLVDAHPRHRRALATGAIALTTLTAGLSLTINSAYLETIYYPRTDTAWWATPDGRAELERLASSLPADSVVAANPYSGGTHLYLTRDVRLVFPTTGTGDAGAQLIGSSLDKIADDPAVCAAAEELGLRYVLTGSTVPYWGRDHLSRYRGIDNVNEDSGFAKHAEGDTYVLWRVPACAAE